MKYALIVDGLVDNVAYDPTDGYVEIPGTVFGGFRQNEDGTFTAPPAPPLDSTAVDVERDRRIATLFTFGGKAYQLDPESQINMTAMGASARFAIAAGALAGNLRWSDPNNDFGWIATDNTITTMDAQTMSGMADAALLWKSENVFAARMIKNITPIPSDYTADSRWPKPAA